MIQDNTYLSNSLNWAASAVNVRLWVLEVSTSACNPDKKQQHKEFVSCISGLGSSKHFK